MISSNLQWISNDFKFATLCCPLYTSIGSRGYNCWKEWSLCTLVFDQFWHCDVFVVWVSAVLILFAPLVVSILKYSLCSTQYFEHQVCTAMPSMTHVTLMFLLLTYSSARFFSEGGKFLQLARHTLFFHENGCSLIGWLVTWYQHAQHIKLQIWHHNLGMGTPLPSPPGNPEYILVWLQ